MLLKHLVSDHEHMRRAGRIAAERFSLSGHDLQVLKRTTGLSADGRPIRLIDRIPSGTLLAVDLPDSIPKFVSLPHTVYEDSSLRVINKPAGLATMASSRGSGHSLEAEYTLAYGSFQPVNRLDKGTGGLMVCAATGHFQHVLSSDLHTDRFIREYIAVVEGDVSPSDGKIDLPIGRVPGSDNLRRIDSSGKPSVTYYHTVMRANHRTMLRLRLITGRTHQIRVHLAGIGHPICGDYLYGSALDSFPGTFALHSAFLFLTHPVSGDRLFFRSPVPSRFSELFNS